jgi:hypothetical protein
VPPLARFASGWAGLALALTPQACSTSAATAPDDTDAAPRADATIADGARDGGRDAAPDGSDAACAILDMPGSPPNACTSCASARCCGAMTACFGGGVEAGSSVTNEGGYSDCYELFQCNTGCIGIPNGGWSACIKSCEAAYPDAIVAFYGVVRCSNDPLYCGGTDGGPCLVPNPDGGVGVWPYPP